MDERPLALQDIKNKHRKLEQHKKTHTLKTSARFATARNLAEMG
jgi:hypothetical protein